MKKFFLIQCLFALGLSLYAQNINCKEDLFPIRDPQKKQYGYVNIFGEWRIIAFYDQARDFKEGLAVVSRKSKFGLIDCNAKVILTCDYDEIKDFENSYAWIKKAGLWGMVDRAGKFVLECKYDAVENVSKFNDLAWLKTKGKWGVFDKETGVFIHEPQFDNYLQLSSDYSLVEIAGKKGMIAHTENKKILELDYTAIDKFAPYLMSYEKDGKLGVIRDNGRILSQPKYNSVKNLGMTLFAAEQDKKFGVFDVWGRQLIPFVLDSVGVFENNAAPIKIGEDYGYINNKGQRILGKFEKVSAFEEGIALIKDSLGFQLISRNGERIGEKYEDAISFGDYFAGKKDGKWEVQLIQKKPQKSLQFVAVYGGIPNKIRVKINNTMRLYDAYTSDFYSEEAFDSIGDWLGSYAYVFQNKKIGLIDSISSLVVEPKYESVNVVNWYGDTYFKCLSEGQILLFDAKGKKTFVPHSDINKAGKKAFIICDAGKCGLIDDKENILIDKKYDQLVTPDISNTKFAFPLIGVQKGKYCLLDAQGNQVVKAKYSNIEYLGNGKYELTQKGVKSIVNQKGELIN